MLIIDAMDLLYTRKFDGFCLVSSDSDFTGLAIRIREEGLVVLGFGERKTPEPFRNACNKFVFTEVLRPALEGNDLDVEIQDPKTSKEHNKSIKKDEAEDKKSIFPTQFLLTALEQSSDDEGWAELGTFGSYLNKLQPDFDSRLYGYKKLSQLVKAKQDLFVTEERDVAGGTGLIHCRKRKICSTWLANARRADETELNPLSRSRLIVMDRNSEAMSRAFGSRP